MIIINQGLYRDLELIEIGTTWKLIDLTMTLLLGLLLFQNIRFHGKAWISLNILPRNFFILLSIFIIIGLIATIRGYSNSGFWAIGTARYTLLGVIFLPAVLQHVNTYYRLKFIFLILILTIIPIWIIQIISDWGNFLSGFTGSNTRGLGAYTTFGSSAPTILLFAYALLCQKGIIRINRNLVLLIFLLTLLGPILAQHRSVWVAVIFGMITVFMLSMKHRNNIRILLIMFVILTLLLPIIVIIFLGMGDSLGILLSKRLAFMTGIENDPTGFWRYRNWIDAIDHIMSISPITGVGFSESKMYWAEVVYGDEWVHNEYINFFQAGGILGLLAYISFLGYPIIWGINLMSSIKDEFLFSMLGGSIAGLVMCVIFMVFYSQPSLMWIFISFIFIIPYVDKIRLESK